jgi:hypothetical protein
MNSTQHPKDSEQKPISWLTVHAAVKEAISQCKDATGMLNEIDTFVNANQITHDAVDDFDETPEEHHKTASELKLLRVLYSKCQEENLRLSLICEQKVREPMIDAYVDGLWTWAASRSEEQTEKTQQYIFARAIEAYHGIK